MADSAAPIKDAQGRTTGVVRCTAGEIRVEGTPVDETPRGLVTLGLEQLVRAGLFGHSLVYHALAHQRPLRGFQRFIGEFRPGVIVYNPARGVFVETQRIKHNRQRDIVPRLPGNLDPCLDGEALGIKGESVHVEHNSVISAYFHAAIIQAHRPERKVAPGY